MHLQLSAVCAAAHTSLREQAGRAATRGDAGDARGERGAGQQGVLRREGGGAEDEAGEDGAGARRAQGGGKSQDCEATGEYEAR